MGSILEYEQSWGRLKEADESKHKLFENLLSAVKTLQHKYNETIQQLDREKETSSIFYTRYREADEAVKSNKKAMFGATIEPISDCNAYVLVLVDGDCMNFLDDCIGAGDSGGLEAAQRLRTSVLEHLRQDIPDLQHDLKILIHVYASLTGLKKTYYEAGILEQRENLERFVRGFNMAHPLCNYIDAGNGKECSDDKICEDLSFHVSLPQCRHVIFGGSADNGYARMLLPYAGDDAINKRITLLKGPPFALELQKLAHKFRTADFIKVFRSAKLTRSVSFPTSTTTPAPVREHPIPSTWAATVATKPAVVEELPAPDPVHTEQPVDWIPRNSEGFRIDVPLKKYYPSLVGALKAKKLCNTHHLLNDCPFDSSGCKHTHGKLSDKEVGTLRYIARTSPCRWGVWCDDPDCYSGHQCTHGDCNGGPDCRFLQEMHYVDTRVVNR